LDFYSATINQLYHPQRSAAVFQMLAEKEKLVFTVTNNAVHDFETYADSEQKVKTMDGVTKFLESNGYNRPVEYVFLW
jgi:NAD-dependent SIR2 family protein deacetylase